MPRGHALGRVTQVGVGACVQGPLGKGQLQPWERYVMLGHALSMVAQVGVGVCA